MTTCKFTTSTTPEGYRQFDRGGVYLRTPTVRATWEFEDGVVVTLNELTDKRQYSGYRGQSYQDNVKAKKARVYITAEQFNVLEDLANRRRRPHMDWKPRVAEALRRIDVPFTKLSWNQKAGCSCGCSPGFVIEGGPDGYKEFYVKLPNAPTVDESLPARDFGWEVT